MFRHAWLILILFSCSLPLTASDSEQARDLLARAKQAAGGAAWDTILTMRTQVRFSTGGLSGPAEDRENVLSGRFVSRFELGPVTGAQGFDGTTTWTQDSSKQVQVQDGGEALEATANEAYRRSRAYWYPERGQAAIDYAGEKQEGQRRFFALRITPKGGRPFDLWLDASTHLIDRIVEKGAIETRTTFFSDYREVHGVRIPFSWRSTNGEERYDQFGEVESVEVNVPLDDSVFRMPAPPPADFTLAGGKTSTRIPFQLVNNHMYVQARLDGKGPFALICDTGGANVVTPSLAKELGLASEGTLQGRGVGEKSEDVGLTKIQTLQIGDATLKDQVFAVFPLESLAEVEGIPQFGLVGYEVFKRFVVKVDYERNELTLTVPSAFSYDGDGTIVPFQFNGQVPQVEGKIDGIPGKFDIDSGSRASLGLLAPFVEKHDLKSRYAKHVEAVTGWGIGGSVRGLVARAKVLELGGVRIEDLVVDLSLQTKGAFIDSYVAGNVGAGVLKRFNLIFDYDKKRVIFEPNANYNIPESHDRSGMWINLGKDGFEVVDVVLGGPAERAGLKPGDTIVAIADQTYQELGLPAARQKLRAEPPGTELRLRIRSGGVERNVTLTLRDLV